MTSLTAAAMPPCRRSTRAAPISVVQRLAKSSSGETPVTALIPAEKKRAQSWTFGPTPYPQILVDINLTDTVVDVAAGQADVAIRFGPLLDSPLTARRLGETGRTIVASPAYLARRGVPHVPEDLHQHDCLNFNFRRLEPVWPFRRDGRDYALTVRGPVEANNGESLTQLALAGVGVTRVGNFSVVDAIAKGELVPLLEDFNPGDREPIHAVFVGGASVPARIRVFVDFLVDQLRPRSVARDATEVAPGADTG